MSFLLPFPDEPIWRRGQRSVFFGFISGVSNLTCEAVAEPPATFGWFDKDGQPVNKGGAYVLTEDYVSTLRVSKLELKNTVVSILLFKVRNFGKKSRENDMLALFG